jgi:N-acylneuraminate cytidylyltransferase
MEKMRIMAIIPARSGSKGVPHKNIRPLAGHPLLAWSIVAAKLAKRIDRVLVSTDSGEYAAIARSYGAETPFLRPAEFAQDCSNDLEFVRHALTWLQENEGAVPDYLAHLRPTCPNRDPAVIDAAIESILADPEADSLCSAHKVDHPPCKYFKLNADGTFSGYMGEELINIPRQQCELAYQPNGHVDVLRSAGVLAGGHLHGSRRLAFFSPDPGDIDTEEDFVAVAERLSSGASQLREYLEAQKKS